MHRLPLIAAAAAALLAPASAFGQTAAYDGKWSVLIVTERGNCDRAFRYPLLIENGNVLYGGKNNFDVSGVVQPGGAVVVSVSKGGQGASGSGRLKGKYGVGTWEAPAGGCAGRWQADKRG